MAAHRLGQSQAACEGEGCSLASSCGFCSRPEAGRVAQSSIVQQCWQTAISPKELRSSRGRGHGLPEGGLGRLQCASTQPASLLWVEEKKVRDRQSTYPLRRSGHRSCCLPLVQGVYCHSKATMPCFFPLSQEREKRASAARRIRSVSYTHLTLPTNREV